MAGFSQLFAIGWRNRELQVATGLGVFSMVSLTVTILHTHQNVGSPYHWLDQLVAASYLSALVYWVLSFATKEAERRNFSPQMESFLLIVGGAAKAGRIALTDFMVTKSRPEDHQ
jgi:Flp pilus assembly protein TadB